ncbi:NGR1 [[Candida] subhashii]|uniref:NGR1 n=1 Tax=[Candida] subhashii TaxID=561895 RepID=A0A8J5QVV5_9ASCO|nr:NGR1 [[Candida] subhashii]KAG7665692.1 NGR1 [[Candida] subhashii]
MSYISNQDDYHTSSSSNTAQSLASNYQGSTTTSTEQPPQSSPQSSPQQQQQVQSQSPMVNPGSAPNTPTRTTTVPKATINPSATTSNTASHQHQQEQELLSGYTVPNPPVSTQQSSVIAAAAAAASTSELDQSPTGPNAGEIEKPRTLWMGDLDPWLDEQGIVDLWWNILQKKVTVKIIRPKITKPDPNYQGLTNSGYCFVEFESFEDAQQALSLNGQLLPDVAMPSQQNFPNNPDNQKKYFRLNWASGATLTAPIVQSPEYSLFVGDLSASTTEAHLLAFFQKNFPNSIKTVRVMTDPISGKSRCFGFVRFTDESERQRALVEMNGVWFAGRPLRVALATPRTNTRNKYLNPQQQQQQDYGLGLGGPPPGSGAPPPSQAPPNVGQQEMMYMSPVPPPMPPPSGSGQMRNAPLYGYYGNQQSLDMLQQQAEMEAYGGGGVGGGGGMGMDLMTSPSQQLSQQLGPGGQSNAQQPFADPNNTTVFVGGLSSEVTEPTLFTLFKPFGIIQQVKIPPGKNCGFVKYSTREEAEEAIAAMQGFIIGGNRVRLSWGRVSAANKKFQQQQQSQQQHHHHQQQQQQVAQMQVAAALSMGLDPNMAAAMGVPYPPPPIPPQGSAGGGPPPPQMGSMPTHPMGMPHPPPTSIHHPFQDMSKDSDSSYDSRNTALSPPFYIPLHGHPPPPPPPHHSGPPPPHGIHAGPPMEFMYPPTVPDEDFINAMRGVNLDDSEYVDESGRYSRFEEQDDGGSGGEDNDGGNDGLETQQENGNDENKE